MSFNERHEAPSYTNKWYKHCSKGGYNECILITEDSVLPNCVGYAWGRFGEISNVKPTLCRGDAERWYNYHDNYMRGKVAKVGAVICWKKGSETNRNDGCGHVAIVEHINDDGSIVISQSGYNNKKRFYLSTIPKDYSLKGYTFQGFIYNPYVRDTKTKYKGAWWTPTLVYNPNKKSEEVRKWQQYMNWLGIVTKKDGYFGKETLKNTKLAQKKLGVTVDGSVGQITTRKAKEFKR